MNTCETDIRLGGGRSLRLFCSYFYRAARAGLTVRHETLEPRGFAGPYRLTGLG